MTTDVRQTAARIMDGMSFNKEKFARDAVAVCDTVDRLQTALEREQQKSAALQRELAAVKSAAQTRPTSSDQPTGMPPGFNEVFGDLFKPRR